MPPRRPPSSCACTSSTPRAPESDEFESFFDRWKVRRQLQPLGRLEFRSGLRYIDLGAWDEEDALSIAMQARHLRGVRDAIPSPIRDWFQRWLVRQKLFGNYDTGSGGNWTTW